MAFAFTNEEKVFPVRFDEFNSSENNFRNNLETVPNGWL